jgi:hypothetical protein
MILGELWLRFGDWRSYEAYVAGTITRRFPGAKVTADVHLFGSKSGVPRQIDVLVEHPEAIAFDCKCYRRKVDVKHVESFLGLLDDVGISSGVLVTTRGYTKAALARAKNHHSAIDLQILSPDRLSEYQHVGAPLIWRGSVGVFLDCPKGWVVDNQYSETPGRWLVAMYPLGHTLESAASLSWFMYANFISKSAEAPTLSAVAAGHEANILSDAPGSRFTHSGDVVIDEDGVSREALLRTAEIETMKYGLEHSLYIDHGPHVLLIVLLSPPGESESGLRILTEVARKSFVMTVHDKR